MIRERKKCGKRPLKTEHQLQAGNEKSLHGSPVKATATATGIVNGTEKEKEIKGTKTVIARGTGTVWTRNVIKIASRTESVTETGTEARITKKKVGARDIIDMRTTMVTGVVPRETMGGEIRIGTEILIKKKTGTGTGPQSMVIIGIRIKMIKDGRRMVERTAKRSTLPETGLMMYPHLSARRGNEVPHYTGRRGLGTNGTCTTTVCKTNEPKKSVIMPHPVFQCAKCFRPACSI
jgi:hypothetical protein